MHDGVTTWGQLRPRLTQRAAVSKASTKLDQMLSQGATLSMRRFLLWAVAMEGVRQELEELLLLEWRRVRVRRL